MKQEIGLRFQEGDGVDRQTDLAAAAHTDKHVRENLDEYVNV